MKIVNATPTVRCMNCSKDILLPKSYWCSEECLQDLLKKRESGRIALGFPLQVSKLVID